MQIYLQFASKLNQSTSQVQQFFEICKYKMCYDWKLRKILTATLIWKRDYVCQAAKYTA